MSTPEEFKQKTTITWGLYVFSLLIAFNIGILYATLLGAKDDINKSNLYTEQEVGGLRSDWERDNEQDDQEVSEMKEDIKELQDYHKEK